MRLLIAGGGTGGHLFPGIAVAEEVRRRGGEVLFVGTARGIEAKAVPAAGYPLELLQVSGLKRVGFGRFLLGIGRLPLALGQSLGILRRFRPDVVLGVGGYASGPLVLAAALARRPSTIMEQNSVPGFTNRVLGRLVDRVFLSFDVARGSFPERKIVMSGNPVRQAFLERSAGLSAPRGPSAAGLSSAGGAGPRLLVVGGSQGARAVNDLVLGAVALWAKSGRVPPIVHQTGGADLERVQAAYAKLDVGDRVRVVAFIDDVVRAYADADLVIARAGATTLAELAVARRPAVLVPLPTAADDHQRINANAYAALGAARVFAQDPNQVGGFAEEVAALLADADRRAAMAAAMEASARPHAARDIADVIWALKKAP